MKQLFILSALIVAACGNDSDINPRCIEGVDTVQVYNIVEYEGSKYALAVTCNIKDIDTKRCMGGAVAMSMAQMPDIKINQIIKAPSKQCFYFLNTNPADQALGPIVEFTSKYKINTPHQGEDTNQRTNALATNNTLPANETNQFCIKDIHSVQVIKPLDEQALAWMGVVCRAKAGDQGFCLGEPVVVLRETFNNLEKGQRIIPSEDECFIYDGDTGKYIEIDGQKQTVKILNLATKYSVTTEKGYQARYNLIYTECLKNAESKQDYNKQADELMCDCYAKYVTDGIKEMTNSSIWKNIKKNATFWRSDNEFNKRCGPGTETFEKAEKYRQKA